MINIRLILNSSLKESGGHIGYGIRPSERRKGYNKINLYLGLKVLQSYGVIIGQSAGSMNLAHTVLCSPEYEDEIGAKYVWDGLGLTEINIEPHFTLEIEESGQVFRNELLNLSINNNIYAICDGSHVFQDENEITLCGEGYIIKDKQIQKICENGVYINIGKRKDVKEYETELSKKRG